MIRHCKITEPVILPGESHKDHVTVTMLDSFDDKGLPIHLAFDSIFVAFTELGNDGWELVQVLKTREASKGDVERDMTYYYFKRHTDS